MKVAERAMNNLELIWINIDNHHVYATTDLIAITTDSSDAVGVVLTEAEVVSLTVSERICASARSSAHRRQTGRFQLTARDYNTVMNMQQLIGIIMIIHN